MSRWLPPPFLTSFHIQKASTALQARPKPVLPRTIGTGPRIGIGGGPGGRACDALQRAFPQIRSPARYLSHSTSSIHSSPSSSHHLRRSSITTFARSGLSEGGKLRTRATSHTSIAMGSVVSRRSSSRTRGKDSGATNGSAGNGAEGAARKPSKAPLKRGSFVGSLDCGTTSVRFIVFDEQAQIIAQCQREFPQYYPHPGWHEHDANEIQSVSEDCIKEACEELEKNGWEKASVEVIGVLRVIILRLRSF